MKNKKKSNIPGWVITVALLILIALVVIVFCIKLSLISSDQFTADSVNTEIGADKEIVSSDNYADYVADTLEGEMERSSEVLNNNVFEEKDDNTDCQLKIVTDGDYLLALVTKETKLKKDYVPADLEPVPAYMNPYYAMQVRAVALEYLEIMWHAAKNDGVVLSIRSAYRSYSTQESLFNDYASRHGEEEANRFSARPGQSEHQLGTAIDFGGTTVDFSAAFSATSQGQWLAENAYKYGFAMSYPENSEDITGYIFEPWHFRFIGVDEALEWKQSEKTLKEFLETKVQSFD